jgi:hypothetical protein
MFELARYGSRPVAQKPNDGNAEKEIRPFVNFWPPVPKLLICIHELKESNDSSYSQHALRSCSPTFTMSIMGTTPSDSLGQSIAPILIW